MQILARSREHKICTVTAGNDDSFWVRRPTNAVLQLGERRKEGRKETEGERKTEGRRKRERERERRKSAGERGTEALESIRPETDLRNPSQSTDTQNWDSVIVSSVRCTLKKQEFVKGNSKLDFTLLFTSALVNINYKLFRQLWPSTQNSFPSLTGRCRAIGSWMGGEGRVGVPVVQKSESDKLEKALFN